jgi:hypothetical protein
VPALDDACDPQALGQRARHEPLEVHQPLRLVDLPVRPRSKETAFGVKANGHQAWSGASRCSLLSGSELVWPSQGVDGRAAGPLLDRGGDRLCSGPRIASVVGSPRLADAAIGAVDGRWFRHVSPGGPLEIARRTTGFARRAFDAERSPRHGWLAPASEGRVNIGICLSQQRLRLAGFLVQFTRSAKGRACRAQHRTRRS